MSPPHHNKASGSSRFAATLGRAGLILGATISLLLGLVMAIGGAWLIGLGGNWYYFIAGLGFIASGILLLRRRISQGGNVLAATVLLTVLWALWELHGKGWMQSWGFDLAGRVGLPLGILLLVVIAVALLRRADFASDTGRESRQKYAVL